MDGRFGRKNLLPNMNLHGITKFVEISPMGTQHAFVMYVYLRDAPSSWPCSRSLRK